MAATAALVTAWHPSRTGGWSGTGSAASWCSRWPRPA